MAELFGDLERLAADWYPHRWWIGAGVIIVLAAIAAFGYRGGWHMVIWRRRRAAVIIGAPLLTLAIWVGWELGSPLFTNKTVEEEFPFAFAAIVPPDMKREDVEKVMSTIAEVDQEVVEEEMPADMTAKSDEEAGVGEAPAAPTPVPAAAKPMAVKLKFGGFRDQDSFHKGSGEATIFQSPDGSYLLRLENLDVTNGPDLRVILTPHPDPNRQGDVKTPGWVELGKLKGNRGNQNYPIPADVDVGIQYSVVIYCKPFHVIFSVAPLEDVG